MPVDSFTGLQILPELRLVSYV